MSDLDGSPSSALSVERVDFITIPTRDPERARAFYHETLGLPLDPNNPDEVTACQVTLEFWNPESEGIEFHPSIGGGPARDDGLEADGREVEAAREYARAFG